MEDEEVSQAIEEIMIDCAQSIMAGSGITVWPPTTPVLPGFMWYSALILMYCSMTFLHERLATSTTSRSWIVLSSRVQ